MPVEPDTQALIDMIAATDATAHNNLKVGIHPLTTTIC